MVIDTSIFIQHFRASDKTKTRYWNLPNGSALYVSAVTAYELYIGAPTAQKRKDVHRLLDPVTLLSFDSKAAEEAALIYQALRPRNQLIDHRDIMIAATAIAYELPLLTLNVKHFSRIPGLALY